MLSSIPLSIHLMSILSIHITISLHSPPLFDATGRTCIAIGRSYNATRGACGAIGGRFEEENNPKDHSNFEK